MGDISRHRIAAPPASRLPRPVAKSVTYVAGLKCYQCPWTEPTRPPTPDSRLTFDCRLPTPDYGYLGPMSVAVASRSFSKNRVLRSELLNRYPDATFNDTDRVLSGAELAAFLRGHDKAITGLDVLDETVFRAVPELRVVSKYGVGLDMIDLAAAKRHGVAVRWTPGVNRQSVAELTIAFMIALCRRIVPLNADLRRGVWGH